MNSQMTRSLIQIEETKMNINIAKLKSILLQQVRFIPISTIIDLLKEFEHIVQNECNLLQIQDPVTIIGDIHGQYRDLLKILSIANKLSNQKQKLLFLGDLVDRGPQGVEVAILIMALKVNYPQQVFIVRGNHESRIMTQVLGFKKEVLDKLSQDIYEMFMTCFDLLPLACIVNKEYFCVHGGISPQAMSLSSLKLLDRNKEIPVQGAMNDFMWSDPSRSFDGALRDDRKWQANEIRGCSIYYGKELAEQFLEENNLKMIIRAHQVFMEGYCEHRWLSNKARPIVVTIFSAPNYCGTHENRGAILNINREEKKTFSIRQFKEEDPKCYLPEKYNAFNISFLKIQEIIHQCMFHLAVRFIEKHQDLKQIPTQKRLAILVQYVRQYQKKQLFQTRLTLKSEHQKVNIVKEQTQKQKNFTTSIFLNQQNQRIQLRQTNIFNQQNYSQNNFYRPKTISQLKVNQLCFLSQS